MNVNPGQSNHVADGTPASMKATVPDPDDLPERLTKWAPWWGFVRRLSGSLFWLSLAVVISLLVLVGVLSWFDVEAAGWGKVLFGIGFIVFWVGLMIAFAGWMLRSER